MRIQAFDFSIDLLRALLWQYDDAARLQSLLSSKQAWYDANQAGFWSDWYRDVFDLRTANDFGLAVWAIILDLPLDLGGGPNKNRPLWGFKPYYKNFQNGNFLGVSSGLLSLSTSQKRLILQLRYFQLVTRGAVTEVNRFLKYLFGQQGLAYVVDGRDMTATYVFDFELGDRLTGAMLELDVLPRPAGVGVTIITPKTRPFGWDTNTPLMGGYDEAIYAS